MTTVLSIIGYIFLVLAVAIILFCIIVTTQLIIWFQCNCCKHCGHSLEYKGLVEDSNEKYYLFKCPKCDSWEKISQKDFYRNLDKRGTIGEL